MPRQKLLLLAAVNWFHQILKTTASYRLAYAITSLSSSTRLVSFGSLQWVARCLSRVIEHVVCGAGIGHTRLATKNQQFKCGEPVVQNGCSAIYTGIARALSALRCQPSFHLHSWLIDVAARSVPAVGRPVSRHTSIYNMSFTDAILLAGLLFLSCVYQIIP